MTPQTPASRALLDDINASGWLATGPGMEKAIIAIEEQGIAIGKQQERERLDRRVLPLEEVPFANEDTRKAYRLAIADVRAILAEPSDE